MSSRLMISIADAAQEMTLRTRATAASISIMLSLILAQAIGNVNPIGKDHRLQSVSTDYFGFSMARWQAATDRKSVG